MTSAQSSGSEGLPEGALSSLVLNVANGPEPKARCPALNGHFVCLVCGELVEARCRRLFCPYCGPVEALKLAAACAISEPERALTLTQVGDTWRERRERMKHLRDDLASAVGPFEWAWSVEPNPRGTGYHVHALQWGSYTPQRLLSERAVARGMGRVTWVNALDRRSASSIYLVKLAADAYGMKAATRAGEFERYLDVNGGRLMHTSRQFWRDGGVPLRCERPRRVAVQRAMERVHGRSICRHRWSEVSV